MALPLHPSLALTRARVVLMMVVFSLVASLLIPWHLPDAEAAVFATGDRVIVDTDRLNLRVEPGTSAPVAGVLTSGTALSITGAPSSASGYTWYPVTGDLGSGWVAGELLRSGGSTSGSASAPAIGIGERTVTTDRLNFRSGPGTGNAVIRVLATGSVLTITDGPVEAAGYWWYQGRTTGATGGDTGWVIALGLNMAPAELPDPTTEYDAGSVVHVDADTLRLRAGASTSSSIVARLSNGTSLTVTGAPEGADGYTWYPVVTSTGAEGWVASDYIAWGMGSAGDDNTSPVIGNPAIVDTPRLNVRAAPGTDAAVLQEVTAGTLLQLLDGPMPASGYHWYEVALPDGTTGWVIGEALVPA